MKLISQNTRECQLHDLLINSEYSFIKWTNGFKNNKSKVTLNCPSHGDFTLLFNNVIAGRRCKRCAVNNRKLTLNEIKSRINSINENITFKRFVGEYINLRSRVVINCKLHGDYENELSNIINDGVNCKECGKERYSESRRTPLNELLPKIYEKCEIKGYKFLGFKESHKNNKSKMYIKCSLHGDFITDPDRFLRANNNCPDCANHGFNYKQPAYLYILKSYDNLYIKIGITNDLKRRLDELKWFTPFKFTLEGTNFYKIGSTARQAEKFAHSLFERAGFKGFTGCSEWLKMFV